MKRMLLISTLLCLLVLGLSAAAAQTPLNVIATTTILADVAQNVAGGLINVESLLPADADTHAYQPTVDDAARIASADLLITVGAGYEAFLGDLLENVGENVPVVVASHEIEIFQIAHADETGALATPESLGTLGVNLACGDHAHDDAADEATAEATAESEPHTESTECDPHVWMNPLNVITWAHNIADAFGQIDPTNAAAYAENADAYSARLEALDLDLQEQIAELPEEQRVLVTNHEFMGYFAAQYGFDIAATVLPGSSTAAESDPQQLAELITFIQSQNVPAIFTEVSANTQIAQLVAGEAGIAVVTTLYSEALSAPDGNAPTYIDLMRWNTETILNALR